MGNFQVGMGNNHGAKGYFHVAMINFQVYMGNYHVAMDSFHVAMGNFHVDMGNCQIAMGKFKNQCTVHDIADVIVSVFSLHVVDCWFKQELPTVWDKTQKNNIGICCSTV